MNRESYLQPTWTIRPWREEDLEAILDLTLVGFNNPAIASRSFFDWGINQCPAGPGTVVVAVDRESGQLVGKIWMAMFHVQVGQRLLRCHDLFNLVVHPEHRLRGVFRSIVPVAKQEASRIGAQVGLGSTRARHGNVGRDTGNYLIEKLPLLIHLLDGPAVFNHLFAGAWSNKWHRPPPRVFRFPISLPAYLLSRAIFPRVRPCPAPAGLLFEELEGADQRFDRFWERVRHKAECMRVRDARHQNWRFRDCPGRVYSTTLLKDGSGIVAYMVTRNLDDADFPATVILDVLAEPGQRGHAAVSWLTRQVIQRARKERQAAVVTMISSHSEELSALLQGGLFRVPHWARPEFLALLVNAYDPSVPPSFFSANAWHFTLGDFDFF